MKRKTQVTQTVQYYWKDANKGKFSETKVKELEQYKKELLSPEDGIQVFMHAIETATMDAMPTVTRKIGRKKGNPKWERRCQLQSSTPKNALLMKASMKLGSHTDRQEKSKPRSKKSAVNPGCHKQKYPSTRNKCCEWEWPTPFP